MTSKVPENLVTSRASKWFQGRAFQEVESQTSEDSDEEKRELPPGEVEARAEVTEILRSLVVAGLRADQTLSFGSEERRNLVHERILHGSLEAKAKVFKKEAAKL